MIPNPNFDATAKADVLTQELADSRRRIRQTEIALKRSEQMLAENIARSRRIRVAVDAADSLVKR
ncbi:hypothetical protein [Mesorhizobium japonicum]|uniref:Msr4805 protein n=1 Tax=Mesorhizobium japonicum (strain LMG 29417 / CECT 9101 / MAFF 303099) TaxID=266835 RepID=Q98D92_RHILO|nr:hypothetical protein [Mesorhizobium japonicum]BAB51379.1 msr4805 [Mesorhizobium japonicum MAFF 303099]